MLGYIAVTGLGKAPRGEEEIRLSIWRSAHIRNGSTSGVAPGYCCRANIASRFYSTKIGGKPNMEFAI